VRFFTPVWNYVDALVHPAARRDPLTAARHRAFIAPRLLGSLAALASFPIYLVFRGPPSGLEAGVFAWLVAPLLIAFFLSRTGRYETAHVFSALALTGLVIVVAACTGGIMSFAAIWLVLVPVDAALSAPRRVIVLSAVLAVAGAGLLLALSAAGVLAPADAAAQHGIPATFGIVMGTLYAAGLALGAEQLARTGVRLLGAEQDRYRFLASNTTDVITQHDAHGAVLFASPAAESLFNVPASALAGHGLFERVHVADRPAYLTALADSAVLGAERTLEFRIRRGGNAEGQGGQFVWAEMRCRPLERAGEARRREVVAVLRDASERKAQERALDIARAESQRANAAKSRFLATVSHELRTPLNAIIGFSDMLSDESLALEAARKREYAKLINESGRHLLSVVNGILDVSRMDSGNFDVSPEPFAADAAITSCCDLLALKAQEAGVDLRTRIARDLPELVADRRAFNQILLNLVSNAIKFTPRNGAVTVGAHRDGRMLVLTVEDTGVGIAEADLPRLGEAFFQARASYDRRHDGTGLGLSIVKGLVHLHDGDMTITSRLGQGTRVTVRLPLEGGERHEIKPVKLPAARAADAAAIQPRVKKRA